MISNVPFSGKFIVGYAPACGEKEYYVGCACEELYFPPSAYFALYGLIVQASFLGGKLILLDFEEISFLIMMKDYGWRDGNFCLTF